MYVYVYLWRTIGMRRRRRIQKEPLLNQDSYTRSVLVVFVSQQRQQQNRRSRINGTVKYSKPD